MGLQAARWFGKQQAQGIDQLRLTLFQCWQARLDRRHLSTGLGDVQRGGDTITQAHLRQAQAIARNLKVFPGDRQVALHRTQLNVVAGGLG
ncbi:hypothetical protein D3C77_742090 [compost metagenome]